MSGRTRLRAAGLIVLLLVGSVLLTVLALEGAVRLRRGTLFEFASATARPRDGIGRMQYDAGLGWTSRPGAFEGDWRWSVDPEGFRRSGGSPAASQRPIITVGDSFTFGDEVADHETWAAHLETILDRRVLNAGAGAYGIDQAFLRAEGLLERRQPALVILAFISDDINRTEFSFYPWGRGWKPYFEREGDSLVLRNVPVPREPPRLRAEVLRQVLGYSQLADALLSRLAGQWWRGVPAIRKVHEDGDQVSALLLARLDSLARQHGARFLAVALPITGRIGGNERLPAVVEGARSRGVEVLDLTPAAAEAGRDRAEWFMPGGHYSPAMNRWVAEQIGAHVSARTLIEAPGGPTSR